MKAKVGIGFIGTGFARRVQIPAFQACGGNHIASVASGSLENARFTAEESGATHFTDDWRETILHPDVDLVCITTPPRLHHEMTLFAIENGKHILCEKPMAMSVAEAKEMTAAASKLSHLALIDHELRFQPGRQTAYRLLRDGLIGKIRHAKAIFQAPHRGDPDIPWNWWSDKDEGGGALGAIASHILDSFNWLLAAEVSSVFCQLHTHIKKRRNESGDLLPVTSDDESNLLLRFADSELTSDATGLVSVSMTEYPRYQNTLEFHGGKGSMRIDQNGSVDFARRGDNDWTRLETDLGSPIPGVLPDTGFSRGFMAFAPRIIAAIQAGEDSIEHAATFADGVNVQRVLDAARESSASGCAVEPLLQ
jgi:predicted dehydrogenase